MAELPSFGGGGMGGGLAQAGGALGGLVGSVIGDAEGEKYRRRALRALQDASRMWGAIPTDINALGEDVYDLGPSAFEDVGASLDPQTRQAQLRALAQLQEIAAAGGMDAQARAQQAEAMGAAAQANRAQQGAILQNFASRGMGGSNAELGARLAAQQASGQANTQAGLAANAGAQQRALQALMQSAALGGDIRSQDYGQASDLARSRDVVAAANQRNRQDVAGRNVDRRNQRAQQNIDNRFRQAAGQQGSARDIADWNMTEEERKRRFHTGIGTGVGTGIGAAVGAVAGGG